MNPRHWTSAEARYLRERWGVDCPDEIAIRLDRPVGSINAMASKLGIRKNPKEARALHMARMIGVDAAQNEREALAAIRDWLRVNGWYVVRMQQNIGSHKGVADLVCTKSGQTLWVEVKGPKGKQRPDQATFQREIESHGGTYVLARSIEDLEGIA